jgi:hypothetical protein
VTDRPLTLPTQLLRRIAAPRIFSAVAGFFGTALSIIRRRAREPALPRMSEEWLRNLDKDSGRQLELWRDSW